MAHGEGPAVGIAVIDTGAIAWAKAYGVLDGRGTLPVTVATGSAAAKIASPAKCGVREGSRSRGRMG
jgi:CubicO group peptidase (beta-lactamase class C family)